MPRVTTGQDSLPPTARRLLRANSLAGRRILVVDDDRAALAQIRSGLESQGYKLEEAYDGPGALSRLRDLKPDLLLLDVEMPGLSGMEVCRIVKANQGDDAFGFVPVILMTARSPTGRVEGLELGADDYLTKPFDPLELSARVKSMLRLKALQDELVQKCRDLDQMNRDLERKSLELERLSRTDPLTGLYNRRYFEERFQSEFSRSQRYRVPITCLMIDIDHFKKVNDTRGHQAGDEALKALALLLRGALREVDLAARFGGEEYVAILPETALKDGRHVAERFRALVESCRVQESGGSFGITVSIGAASYPVPNIASAEALLRAADEALYRAKERGRNRVEVHEE